MSLTPAPTTAQSLGSLLKSARDIMRKDKGLNGDLDRLTLLTWIMFLKFLDDLEHQRADEASLAGKKFKPAIEAPYRWRDWAARADGVTGDELLAFINHEECTGPDGTKGPGLFAYLRKLTSSNGDDRRDVIATVFKGVDNRMKSGYLLRDVVNKVAGIHFTAADELHTLGALYESMLREMRDAAGDSGEFYTPRAVVRLMVAVSDPRLGETVLDPASGTGGFLVEAFTHLGQQRSSISTPSSGCRMASSRPTPASRRISSSSTAPVPRAKSGITSTRCRRAGRTTPKRRRSSSRNSRRSSRGGAGRSASAGRKTNRPGKSPPPTSSPRAPISTGPIREGKRTSPISRLRNSPRAS